MLKREKTRLLALLLALALLLGGCAGTPNLPGLAKPETTAAPTRPDTTQETQVTQPSAVPVTEAPTHPTTEAPTEPVEEPDAALIRWQNGGQKDYLPDEPVALVPFSQMVYARPDVETLYADFDALAERAKGSEDAEALLEDYYGLYSRYISFYSMDALANARYSLDTTDPYYQEEYNFCQTETPNLEEKFEILNKAFAASPSRDRLEELYFGEGYFSYYDDYEVYTNPEYLRLSQEEAALLTEYRELTAEYPVTYNGETKSLDEWMVTDSYATYIGALRAYYETYNPTVGDVYVRLVRVRQQLAAALGYDSYAEYSYAVTYSRDYTPEEGTAFVAGIRTHLMPVLAEVYTGSGISLLDYGSSTERSLREMLRSAAERIGGTVWDAYRFMTAYELCDISKSAKKVEASFQTYLYDYEAPFLLLNAQGSGSDYTTFAHEFGHFTDGYYNYGANEDLETAETFSQAMEFLALTYSETLSQRQRDSLLKLKLVDLLETFVYQGAYADFEARVYALDPQDLTLERINDVYRTVCQEYDLYEPGFDFYYSQSWIDVLHFFEVPYYIISYCVSAETALQVYRLEKEEAGAGAAAYFRLLDRDYSAGVRQVMEDAGLESPFREDVLEQTADFFRAELGLD